jgi:hypothetical protein
VTPITETRSGPGDRELVKRFGAASAPTALQAPGLRLATGAAVPRSEPAADPERTAHCSLRLFLDAAFPSDSGSASAESLAAAIFAHGAVDGVAARTALDPGAHARLERCLLRGIAGSRRRAIAAWRRTLRELEATSWGERLHRRGRLAAEAWLRGEAPDAHLAAALRRRTQDSRTA